jgi:polyvinyl alcohol dehydrogenase (cytochrome)
MAHRFLFLLVCLLSTPVLLPAQDGATLYRRHCAMCHEASAQTRAPSREALRQLTPERIVYALESIASPMSNIGLGRTREERRAIATYLSGKAFGTEKPLDLERMGCKTPADGFDPASGPDWNGWSPNPSNNRFQNAAAAGLEATRISQLKLKWAFAFPGDIEAYSQPTIIGGRVFVGSEGRRVYSLDRITGCVHWSFTADAGVRAAITVGPPSNSTNSTSYAAYVSDLSANVYALDAASGRLLWKTSVDRHRAARITGAPRLHAGRLYVPVASLEEGSGAVPDYECCTFRGSIVALDAATGKQIWKTYTIAEEPRVVGKNSKGVRQWGPSGAGVWSSPTLDVDHKTIYVATGDNYSFPASRTSDAIMALDMETGRMLWVRQLTEKDAWNVACIQSTPANCPQGAGPDFDFASSAILVNLPGGRRALVAGQKSGVVHALDPDREGEILWQVQAGRGGIVGGIEWGPAADEKNIYVAVSDAQLDSAGQVSPKGGGGLLALQLADGKQIWRAEPAPCPETRKGCSPAQSAAVTVIPGVVFSASLDGHLRAYSATDGHVIWDFDTVREFNTVNGVPGHGGAINGPGATAAGGMLFVNSGYGFLGQMPGNVLLAFAPE